METKDQSNQNPELTENNQDENSLPVEETVENAEIIAENTVPAESATDPEPVAEVVETEDEGVIEAGLEGESQTEEIAEVTAVPVEPEAEVVAETESELTDAEEVPSEEKSELTDAEEVPAEGKTELTDAEEVPTEEKTELTDAEEVQAEEKSELTDAGEVTAEEKTESVAEESVTEQVVVQAEEAPVAETEAEIVESELEVEATPVEKEVSATEETLLIVDESGEEDESDEVVEEHEVEPNSQFDNLTREQLVEKLEELVQDSNVNAIKTAVGLIRIAFLKLNKEFKQELYTKLAEVADETEVDAAVEPQPVQDDEVEERFKAAFNIYKHNKGKYNEEQEKVKLKNLEAKTQILEELKMLINSEETLKKTYDEFKTLQDNWKKIGMVPKGEINTLWQNYHFLVEKFFDKVKINKELKDLDLKKNLEAKIHLCEKAEELVLESSIIKSFKQLQQYHEEWKEIGPVPQDKKDELWDRFRSATEKINERRREYYTEMQDGLEQNYTAKVILCEKAEQILGIECDSIKAWQDTTAQITELLKIWKSIGPAPKKQNNEIWARFKTSLDAFFNSKKDFFNKLKDQQMNNFNLKLDLCVQAEALRSSTDWKNTSRELINMQNEWKKIGPVPRKQSDRIWKRFRAACDEFFSTKSEYFKNVSGHEDENMKLKLALIDQVKEFEVGEDRNQAVESLKDYQRQWMEIGHVPIKEKEKLQTEFRALINKHFEKLKMESVNMGAMNYRSRIDKMSKEGPDAGRLISKERGFVLGKIQQLQDDIKLWENNIGFFAASKTANLLKQEFEKKIDQAKEELHQLEAKLKMLREANQ